jgi:hypothetical protein
MNEKIIFILRKNTEASSVYHKSHMNYRDVEKVSGRYDSCVVASRATMKPMFYIMIVSLSPDRVFYNYFNDYLVTRKPVAAFGERAVLS